MRIEFVELTIPRARVRYEITSASAIICIIRNNQEILLDLADFILQERSEDIVMVEISRA